MSSIEPKSRVEIRVSCSKLTNKDLTSKSDPCCVMYLMKEGIWTKVGRTETIMNNLNPCFEKPFEIDYVFDEVQMIRFELYDVDNFKSQELKDDDFLGQLQTTVGEVVSENPLTRPLIEKKGIKPAGGSITLRVMDAGESAQHDTLQLVFRAEKLDKKDLMGKSDPFLEFCRKTLDGNWEVVLRTDIVKSNLNPTWKPLKVAAQQLSGGDYNNPIKIVCKDWDKSGKHDSIGSFTTSVTELIRDAAGREWPCINESKVGKKKYEKSGVIFLTSCEIVKE